MMRTKERISSRKWPAWQGAKMQILNQFIVACLTISGLAATHPSGERYLQITAMIYQTPPEIVTTTWGGPDGKGGIIGGSIGGMITSQFPDATVMKKLEGPAEYNNEAIRAYIKRNFIFQCGDTLSRGLPADIIEKRVFCFQDGKLKRMGFGTLSTDNQESQPSPSPQLNLDLISEQNGRWILALIFEIAKNSPLLPGNSPVLFDQIIGMRTEEPILIGFSSIDPQKGKFIHWVALYMEWTDF